MRMFGKRSAVSFSRCLLLVQVTVYHDSNSAADLTICARLNRQLCDIYQERDKHSAIHECAFLGGSVSWQQAFSYS